jgi:hypothetical protein
MPDDAGAVRLDRSHADDDLHEMRCRRSYSGLSPNGGRGRGSTRRSCARHYEELLRRPHPPTASRRSSKDEGGSNPAVPCFAPDCGACHRPRALARSGGSQSRQNPKQGPSGVNAPASAAVPSVPTRAPVRARMRRGRRRAARSRPPAPSCCAEAERRAAANRRSAAPGSC